MNLKELCDELERRPRDLMPLSDCECASCALRRQKLATIIAAARLAPTWISVEEPPDNARPVHVACQRKGSRFVTEGCFSGGKWRGVLGEPYAWAETLRAPPSPLKEGR